MLGLGSFTMVSYHELMIQGVGVGGDRNLMVDVGTRHGDAR